jgi:hypothetical protein
MCGAESRRRDSAARYTERDVDEDAWDDDKEEETTKAKEGNWPCFAPVRNTTLRLSSYLYEFRAIVQIAKSKSLSRNR